jgi:hypothetical protein
VLQHVLKIGLVSDVKGGKQTERVSEQDAEVNILTEEG